MNNTDRLVPLSIIIPVINEADRLAKLLSDLRQRLPYSVEILVADGGSSDNSLAEANRLADKAVLCSRGRALQMNAAAEHAAGEWLLFLHADTQLPNEMAALLEQLSTRSCDWGFFRVRLSGRQALLRLVERGMNLRSRLTHVATGDQCLFVRRSVFEQLAGFPELPLMEDVAMSKRLRAVSKPFIYATPVITSSRRWQQNGVIKTVLLMWLLRLAYFLGCQPRYLARLYYG
ncbi:MAG: rSAM/selenodomain-associated transferase 2 [Oceanicoccus sp.]|jgi:rSAM/selenodomain-associated transferase 2